MEEEFLLIPIHSADAIEFDVTEKPIRLSNTLLET